MTQVKYDYINKFVQCRCEKQETIQLGWGYLIYANIFSLVCWTVFAITGVAVLGGQLIVLLPVGLTVVSVLLAVWGYRSCTKEMREKGHTSACSQWVAKRATWYQSLYSEFKVGVDPAKVHPEGDYATLAIGLWFMTGMINWSFLLQYAYEEAGAIVYPILFVISIALSIIPLFRIKKMSRTILSLYILNIATSNLLLSLYVMNVFVKFA